MLGKGGVIRQSGEAPSPYSKKVPGLAPGLFSVESTCSPRARVGSLQVLQLPTTCIDEFKSKMTFGGTV